MGTKITEAGTDKIYEAAQRWVDRALRTDDSLFTPGEHIWSSRWLEKLHQQFLNNPNVPGTNFFDKLRRQLEGSPPEVYQLMAEALYLHYLIARNITAATKQSRISQVLAWSETPVEIPQELITALDPGILNAGTFFNTSRPFQVGFLIEFVEQWKGKPPAEQQQMLNCTWDFKDFAMHLNLHGKLFQEPTSTHPQQAALLHLVFPGTFEAIVSANHKESIAKTFARFVTGSEDDIDRQLQQIRQAIETQYGARDHFFYQPEIQAQWNPGYKPDLWEPFIGWAKVLYEWEHIDDRERAYKLEVGKKLAAVKEAVSNGDPDWDDQLRNTLLDPASYLRDWRAHSPLLKLERSSLGKALRQIWGIEAPGSLAERVRAFQEHGPFGTAGVMASILLMADDPRNFPMYAYTPLKQAYQLTGYQSAPNDSPDAWDRYDNALGFWDEFIKQASDRGLQLRDRLDAQSLVWCITQYEKKNLPEDWPEDLKDKLLAYRGEKAPPPPPSEDPWLPENVATLATDLLWAPEQLQEIIDDLQEKHQVIFYGPPGTGKTYVARAIAQQCRLNGGGFEIVQFHPSYSYEDFVEGFRPRLKDGQPGFDLVSGPLLRIAEKARQLRESTFILVIDELNRGNVAKVFGELYFLLEYRNEQVQLQYGAGRDGFSLPPNLWFICTMNTADRSIALMDAALRRRFYFAPFFPDEPPIKGLLRRWLDKNGHDTWAAELVDSANSKLDRDVGIGPSYFMGGGQVLDQRRVRRIWKRAVLPYIEEQFLGDSTKMAEFDLDHLIRRLAGASEMHGQSSGDQLNGGTPPPQADDDDTDSS